MPDSTASPLPKELSKELRSLIFLALPIMAGQLAQTANGFVDTVMAGRVSPADLAAVAVGSSLWVPLYLFMSGVLIATTPMIAQLVGARKHRRIDHILQQALWLGILVGAIGWFALRNGGELLRFMEVDEAVRPITIGYLQGISWGFPAIAIYIVLRCFSEALSHTKPMMITSVIGLIVNIPTNYVLIFGKLGFPAMGGAGCGWATAVVMWLMVLMMGGYVLKGKIYRPLRVFRRFHPPEFNRIWETVAVGLPIGLAIFFEVSIFAVIALLLGSVGAETLAGHQIALNFSSLTFMVPLSIALALTVRVGQATGERNLQKVRYIAKVGLFVTTAAAAIIASIMAVGRFHIGHLYTDDEKVLELAAVLLLFAALFQISDGLQVAASGALRGFKDTKVPMYYTIVAYWMLGLPVGYILGMTNWLVEPMGARGFWIGLVVGLTSAAIMLNGRLFSILAGKRLGYLFEKKDASHSDQSLK